MKRLNIFSKCFLAISIFFFTWATYNTKYKMKTNFDLGLICFSISVLSSLYLYIKTRNGVTGFTSTGIIGRAFVTIAHVIVSFTYAIGAFMACTVGKKIYIQFATYCVIFTFLWSCSAYVAWILITNTLEIGLDDDEDDEKDNFDQEIDYIYESSNIDDILSRRSKF